MAHVVLILKENILVVAISAAINMENVLPTMIVAVKIVF
jgi:hypothetical protein